MVRTKHEITQSRTAFPPSPGQVEWTFLDLCCFTHSRRFSTLIPNQQLSRCEAAAGWCCVAPCIWVQWDVMLYSTPQPAQCPLSAPLSWSPPGSGSDAVQRLFTSSDPRLRRQWLAVTPIMLLTQPPAQNHIRLMTRGGWQSDVSPLLSQLPGRCIPRPKLIKMIRFVSVTANSSVCLHPTIRDTCSQEKVKRCWIHFPGSYTFNDSSRYVYQNSSAGFWTIHERMKLRNDRHIFCKPVSIAFDWLTDGIHSLPCIC